MNKRFFSLAECDEIIPLHETSKSTVLYTNMHHNRSERDIESLEVEVRFMTVKIAKKCLTRVDNDDIIKRYFCYQLPQTLPVLPFDTFLVMPTT